MIHPASLECAPLDPSVDARLSERELRRVEPLHQALLSPLDHETVDDWRRAVNRALVEAFGSDAAKFQLPLEGMPLHVSEGIDPAVLGSYAQEIMPELSRTRRMYRRLERLGAGNRSMLWQRDLEWLYRSDYFHEMIVPMRAFDPLWAGVPVDGSRYPASIHTYHDRRRGSRRVGAREVALMRLVRPALAAGVGMVVRTAARRAALVDALDRQRDGALVFDLQGRLLHRNPAAASVARTEADERALARAGAAMARGLAGDDLLDTLAPANAAREVTTRGGRYRLSAVRVAGGAFAPGPVVLVTVAVAGGSERLPGRERVRERFGLTRRQAEVALLLARRKSNAEIAEALSISSHTARHHTEAVMSVLGVGDRREVEGRLRRAN